jgi:ubiquinone/menaquinone biosynthesis C-methylase UbiE
MSGKHQRETFGAYYGGVLGGGIFRWLDIQKIRILDRSLRGRKMESARVLDLGGGAGAVSAALSRRLPECTIPVADSDEGLLSAARGKGLQTAWVNFDVKLPFDDSSFDVVMMVDSMEHVACRRGTMREVGRLVKREGLFIVFTPPYDSLSWVMGEKFHRLLTRRKADHISPFTKESLEWTLSTQFNHWTTRYLNFGLTLFGMGWSKKGVV